MRAQGAGGLNVNKVTSAIHLLFDIPIKGVKAEWHLLKEINIDNSIGCRSYAVGIAAGLKILYNYFRSAISACSKVPGFDI